MHYSTRKTCRQCDQPTLSNIFSLGEQYVSDFLDSSQKGKTAPLELIQCTSCGLLQLRHTYDRKALYKYYWYKSGLNESMRKNLQDVVTSAIAVADLKPDDIVVDVGCNDGTLLRMYPEPVVTVGFEPAKNLLQEARQGNSLIINSFFQFGPLLNTIGRAKVITTVAMFYDVDDPNQFVKDVKAILRPDGVWINQMNYVLSMLQGNEFDNIGHEHVTYYGLKTFAWVLARYGLEIFNVEFNSVNGGSFRTYIGFKGQHPISEAVAKGLARENKHLTRQAYVEFAQRIRELKKRTVELIRSLVERGNVIYAYGAGNRGNTILQYYDLNERLIKAAVDRNQTKIGRRTVGSNIPIISEEQMRQERPDYLLVLPYFYLPFFKEREAEYLSRGGKLIVPLPELKVIGAAPELKVIGT